MEWGLVVDYGLVEVRNPEEEFLGSRADKDHQQGSVREGLLQRYYGEWASGGLLLWVFIKSE